ncbi:MAG: hypothetical protein PHY12_07630 [Eubacteriales bacterium]|nr:hypothetical protein [Eubacteriales bacterium]
MNRKRFWSMLLVALALCAQSALADSAVLDQALSRWMDAQPAVRFSASIELKAWQPFQEQTLAMLNGVLKHAAVNASVQQDAGASLTGVQLTVDGDPLFELTERQAGTENTLELSLLPNRVLTSAAGSPMDALLKEDAYTAPVEGASQSDPAEAFSMLAAISEAEISYQALFEACTPYAEEKKASYNIKGIGSAKWSKIARLTTEQSGAMLEELRAVLMSGMDESYRAELSQITFQKGFVVGLYQDADRKDMAVYMKGNVEWPDGEKRALSYQWAFVNRGTERKDTYKFEVVSSAKPRDSRLIAASMTQELFSDHFSFEGTTETTLKRSTQTDVADVSLSLYGKISDAASTCVGTASQSVKTTTGDDSATRAKSVKLDLALTPDADGAVLSGTVDYEDVQDKNVQTALRLTLAQNAAQAAATGESLYAVTDETGGQPEIQIISPDGETRPASSVEQIADESAQTGTDDYLVGQPPIGMTAYAAPSASTDVALDGMSAEARAELLAEAAQNLAGGLLRAVAKLPAEDAALLKDGMTDADYAALLELLN